MKYNRLKYGLLAWLAGILLPVAGLREVWPAYRQAFDAVFGPPWMHVLMHSLLFAVLAVLAVTVFSLRLSWKTALLVLGGILLVGAAQEAFQAVQMGFLPWDGAVFDLGVDVAGGGVGLVVTWVIKLKVPSLMDFQNQNR